MPFRQTRSITEKICDELIVPKSGKEIYKDCANWRHKSQKQLLAVSYQLFFDTDSDTDPDPDLFYSC